MAARRDSLHQLQRILQPDFESLEVAIVHPNRIRPRLAQRVQAELQRPVDIGGQEVFVAASMGIALGSNSYLSADRIMQAYGATR